MKKSCEKWLIRTGYFGQFRLEFQSALQLFSQLFLAIKDPTYSTFLAKKENKTQIIERSVRKTNRAVFYFRIAGRMLLIQGADAAYSLGFRGRAKPSRFLIPSGVYENSHAACLTLRYDFKSPPRRENITISPSSSCGQGSISFPPRPECGRSWLL